MRVVLVVLLVLFGTMPVEVQQAAPPILPFESVPNPLQLPPDIHFGEVAGVAVNSKGHVFVFSRGNSTGPAYMATAAQLLEFDATGKFVREIGKNLYAWSYAHAVRVDKDDDIWAVDKGSDTIVKFNPQGRVVWVFGRKGEASHLTLPPDTALTLGGILKQAGVAVTPGGFMPPTHADGLFNQPTDVAWDAHGNTYFTDGYVNSRVGKADKNGDWVASWGARGTSDGEFHTPHGVAVAPNGEVFIADRNNRRIQVFDGSGTFLRKFTVDVPPPANAKPALGNYRSTIEQPTSMSPGAPDAICITPGANPVLFIVDLFPGRLYKLSLDGKVLGIYGGSGKNLGQFGWAHALACPSENEVWVGELLNWRVQKLVAKGTRSTR